MLSEESWGRITAIRWKAVNPFVRIVNFQQSLDRAGTAQCRRWERSQLHQNGRSLRKSRTVVGFSAVFIARHSSRSSINVFEVYELLFFQIHNKSSSKWLRPKDITLNIYRARLLKSQSRNQVSVKRGGMLTDNKGREKARCSHLRSSPA